MPITPSVSRSLAAAARSRPRARAETMAGRAAAAAPKKTRRLGSSPDRLRLSLIVMLLA